MEKEEREGRTDGMKKEKNKKKGERDGGVKEDRIVDVK